MKKKSSTYKSITREKLSNPNKGCSHKDLLRKSKVKLFDNNYEVETLKNGRIVLKSLKK